MNVCWECGTEGYGDPCSPLCTDKRAARMGRAADSLRRRGFDSGNVTREGDAVLREIERTTR